MIDSIKDFLSKIVLLLCGITLSFQIANFILCRCIENGFIPEEDTLFFVRDIISMGNVIFQTCKYLCGIGILYMFASYIQYIFRVYCQ